MIRSYFFILLSTLQVGAATGIFSYLQPNSCTTFSVTMTMASKSRSQPKSTHKSKNFFKKVTEMDNLIALLLDLLLLLILFLGAYYGYSNGILSNLILSFCGASPFFIARFLADGTINDMIKKQFPAIAGIAPVIAFVLVLTLYFVLFIVVSGLLNFLFRKTLLVHLDNVFGAIFYLFFTAVLLSLVIYLLEGQGIHLPPKYTDAMHLYKIVRDICPQIIGFIQDKMPDLELFLGNLFKKKK